MNITHDIIAAVTGPGWKYGLSRILINDQNEGVVFIAGQDEPFAFMTVDSTSTSRGTGHNDDGQISWRRRGSSCQYKLAKCKVSTETMTQRWTDALDGGSVEPEPVVEDEPEPEETRTLASEVPAGSAKKVMDWVGSDVDRARAALQAENDGQQRKGLTSDLEKMIEEDVL